MNRNLHSISRRKTVGLLGSACAGMLLESVAGAKQTNLQGDSKPLIVASMMVELQIVAASKQTLRISVLPIVNGKAEPIRQSLVLAPNRWPSPSVRIRSKANTKIAWAERRVLVRTNPIQIEVTSRAGEKVQQLEIDSQSGAVRFLSGKGPVYGLGESGRQFDRRGASYPMKHGQGVPNLRVEGARIAIPWLVGTGGWALFFHLPSGTFNLGGGITEFLPHTWQTTLPLDIFLVASKQPAEILAEYARLTGFPHMPPAWALGYQQSHRTLSSRNEVMAELQKFREQKLPCDVMIYLGTGFCPSGWNLGHGSYKFNPKAFPDPKEMIAKMHQEHFRIVLHEDKPPKRLYGSVTDTGTAAADPEDAASYWEKHQRVFEMGVDGWWADEGDWLDPLSCLIRNRMYWQGSIKARPNVRPYTLNRNGYAGTQRYGWVWSGDIESTWQALRDQVASGINTGLSGMPYWGTDTGGFITTPELTGELYVRWFQFGAFCPLFRSHGRTWKLRLPWAWDTGSYGPIEGPVTELPPEKDLHNPHVEPICRKYLKLRSKLMPYLYTVVRESHDSGLPIMRGLWLHYPEDALAVQRGDEYLWGPSILVAPVVEKGAKSRRLYLPLGTWYDFWTDEKVSGGREITKEVDLATVPLYIRAGSILPFARVEQYVNLKTDSARTFRIYPGSDGKFSLYEDDGASFNYEKGEYARLEMSWSDHRREFAIRQEAGPRWSAPGGRHFEVQLAGGKTARKIFFDGTPSTLRF